MTFASDTKITFCDSGNSLQQMCNYIAIAETKNSDESLNELILNTLVTFEEEKASSVQEVADILKTIFGVEVSNRQILNSLDHLMSSGYVQQPFGTNYILTSENRIKIKARINNAFQLQESVKTRWLEEINGRFPDLNTTILWDTLIDYLAKAFLRHGIQVAIFLDPSVEIPLEYSKSLSALLSKSVQSRFEEKKHQEDAQRAIVDFMISVSNNRDRTKFMSECADGAANYFSLGVSLDSAMQFRDKLNSINLFCDTNFLFGILDLHIHPLVDVSNHLFDSIVEHKLPIKMRCHAATILELKNTITYYAGILRSRNWSRAISRAAGTSRYVSGIELKYHQKNAEIGMDVESFMRPYNQVEELLKYKNIDIYRPLTERLTERATLEAEYQEYLKRISKEKLHDLIVHDVKVLDSVRTMRESTEAALLVTCDYALYRFDSETSRKDKTPASVILPNILWQLLRPFISINRNFDKSFAETFSVPEFRTIGSDASKACSKMLSLLATYKDFPELTATRMLSNGMLIESLLTVENEAEFKEKVELAIVSENQALLEEHVALKQDIESLRAEKEQVSKKLEINEKSMAEDNEMAQKLLLEKEKVVQEYNDSKHDFDLKTKEIAIKLASAEEAKTLAEKTALKEKEARQKSDGKEHWYALVASLSLSLLIILMFEIITYGLPWNWLMNHNNSYSIQAGADIIVLTFFLGLFRPDWREKSWWIVLVGMAFVVVSLLAGPIK